MARDLDPGIADVLRKYGENPDDKKGVIWDCHGTWVVYHRALERVAARAGISFNKPDVLRAERDEAVIMVAARMDDRTDWDIGEALINVNYRVSGKQAAYVYAMALKRARDRLILKLVGLHGLAYSEEEADEFREGAREPTRPVVTSGSPANDPAVRKWVTSVEKCATRADLSFLFDSQEWREAKAKMSLEGQHEVMAALDRHPANQRRAAA